MQVKQIKSTNKYSSFLYLIIGLTTMSIILASCSYNVKDFNSAPNFSPVRADLGYASSHAASIYPPAPSESRYSLYRSSASSFYRDPRAMKPGDVLTVQIFINDRASLNNKSDLKRDSNSKYTIGAGYSFMDKLAGSIEGGSSSQSKGDTKVERQENIRLSIAAIVTDVLPNGNLVINGSQEVRVNNELRILNIVGLVRPRDISGNNMIDYDKIAEARISYGGRGRMSEIQQPPYGQQLLNQIAPF
ncbi:flagellar L-ring protein precursor FlgH [Bartonella sp. A1379B]|uniref:Flagellar L-ring protein n=2 Tax=Bartonella rochalimae ATCC BAA-1498 TaxID=685782 RepID=A0A067W3H5_9HYPH|nr:flagellar L-ring protein precursor FlgH [Bartonella sp. A1379B]AQX23127.1 flagellar L-ring protein precursor FlgH [Bartonella sp. 11B]AQX23574.1 flagellar L-ring protein precursor FlgH [Bartonella sp. 114]AQX25582.1 flagellar L-ring protein precursor FlgH [Bartonella sp. Coyote22sub2]KEC54259.1 flagellar L-ring protein [Bartonella rochalimae ATCC BAA-1498]